MHVWKPAFQWRTFITKQYNALYFRFTFLKKTAHRKLYTFVKFLITPLPVCYSVWVCFCEHKYFFSEAQSRYMYLVHLIEWQGHLHSQHHLKIKYPDKQTEHSFERISVWNVVKGKVIYLHRFYIGLFFYFKARLVGFLFSNCSNYF